jgi:ABC-2 type transport system ATP-binding protein
MSLEDSQSIVIEHLSKTFPEPAGVLSRVRRPFAPAARRTVIDDISFSIKRGELVGLLGGNGAGKTTLLQILSTLSKGDAGVVTIGGIRLDREPARIRRTIGFCGTADRGFYYRLNARENLSFFCTLSRQVAAREQKRRIETVLEFVGLERHGDRLYAHLSTGMRQRLAVARALLGDPPVLLFDEPTRAVDPIHADSLRQLIRKTLVDELGKTVLLATNVLEEAWAICHRVAILREGRLVALDTPAALSSTSGVPADVFAKFAAE